MQWMTGILTHTPLWVWALLAYLIWQGIQSLSPRTMPVWRVLVVPCVFIVMGLSRLVMRNADSLPPYVAWLMAAFIFGALAFRSVPKLLSVDRAAGQVTRPGSPLTLIRNVIVFVLQYAVGVSSALHVANAPLIALSGSAVSGATAGYFIGWAASFLRAYRTAA